MTKKNEDKVLIGDGENVIELIGEEKKAFELSRQESHQRFQLLEAEYKKKEEARKSALKKLAEIAGLTDEEIAAII